MHSEEEYYQKADNLILISCQAVQGVFRDRWKHSTGTPWTESSADTFLQGEGKDFYRSSKGIRKQRLEAGNLEEWDLTLVIDLLLRVESLQPDKEQLAALKELRAVRNELAHIALKKMSASAYQEIEGKVQQSLSALGLNKKKIDKLISNLGVTSSVAALEQATKIQKLGDEQCSKGNYRKAIEHYDEGLLVPSLLPETFSNLYRLRAACYLEIGKKVRKERSRNGNFEQAMMDIKKALSYDDASWKVHFTCAKIYRVKHELKKAIQHLQSALVISPGQDSVKLELDECTLEHNGMEREDHAKIQKTVEEATEYVSQAGGLPVTPKQFVDFAANMNEADKALVPPGQQYITLGDQYANGWNVRIDYRKAVQYYAKADALGNAEGTYNLSLCYMNGTGVRKDLRKSVELLQKGARMPEKVRAFDTWVTDGAVVSAQQALGLRYQEGVVVPQDYKQAVYWYEKAANNGCELAANNLGLMYFDGCGVKKDLKMAELYWKRGMEGGSSKAASHLCSFYLAELEPDKAALMIDKAIKLGDQRMPFDKNHLLPMIQGMKEIKLMEEKKVVNFEKTQGLGAVGLTFRQRKKRMNGSRNASNGNLSSILETSSKHYLKDPKRIKMVKAHREEIKFKKPTKLAQSGCINFITPPRSTLMQHKLPKTLSDLEEITLEDMDPTVDKIFERKILHLTVIEDPAMHISASINLVAMDDNKETVRVFVYNVPHNEEMREKLTYGKRLAILNPYMRVSAFDVKGIRVDEPKCILNLDEIINMCRYCYQGNAESSCGKCKRAIYCSRDCQVADWKELNHKAICTSN